jgi:uncharacterized protein (DUF4415 family)
MRKKPLSEDQKAALRRVRDIPDSQIDFSDAPELTDEQWAKAMQPNRAREYVGVRLDWDVLAWLKKDGPGHSTRINQILRVVMEHTTDPMRHTAKMRRGRPNTDVLEKSPAKKQKSVEKSLTTKAEH